MVHPLLMVQVPVDGQDDALLERGLGVPAQIVLDLGGVDAVAAGGGPPLWLYLKQKT